MARLTLITAAALACLAVAGFSASGEKGDAVAKPSSPVASVRLADCARGPAADNRLAIFRGAMRRLPRTRGMRMRFKLQERVGTQGFRTVKAPGLEVWRKSRPGVRRFAYRQRVLALAEGSAYRTVVSFRWSGSDGKVIRRATRRSRPCRQPGPLPNLLVARVGGGQVLTGTPVAVRYFVHVINRGQTAALRFGVSLAVDGGAAATQTVTNLAPGETRKLVFSGPPCEDTVTAVADPEDVLRETIERDNSLTAPCPSRR